MSHTDDNEGIYDAIFSATIDGVDDIIHVIDKNFNLLKYNEAYRKWLRKLNLDENVIGRRLFEIFPFRLVDNIQSQYERVFKTGISLTTKNQIEFGGTLYYFIIKKIPVKVEGRVERAITILSERTELSKTKEVLHESLDKLKIFFDNTDEMLLIVNSNGIIIQTNSTALKKLDYGESELIGKNVEELYPIEQREFVRHIFDEVIDGRQYSNNVQFITKIGVIIPVEIRISRIKWGENEFFIGNARDISEKVLLGSLRDIQYDLATKLSLIRDIDEIYKLFLDAAINLGNFDSGGIYVFTPGGDLKLVHHHGLSTAFVEKKAYFNASTVNVKIVLESEPIFLLYDQLVTNEHYFSEGLKVVAVIPIKYQGKVIASLNLASHVNKEVPLESKRVLETLAIQCGIGIAMVNAISALQEQKELYQTIVSEITDEVYIHDISPEGGLGKIIAVNDVTCKKLGYTKDELLSFDVPRIDAPESHVDVYRVIKELMKDKSILFEQVHMTKDGKRIPVEINARTFIYKDHTMILSLARDITERKRNEFTLRESEEKFSRAFIINPSLLTITQLKDGKILEASDGFLDTLGYSREEVIGKTTIELGIIDPVVRSRLVENFTREGMLRDYEIYIHTKSEEIRYGLLSARKFVYNGIDCMLIVMLDNTERKKVKDALFESEIRYRTLFETSKEGILVIDVVNFEILFANPAFCRMFGHSLSQLTRRHIIDFHPPSIVDIVKRDILEIKDNIFLGATDVTCLRKDGSTFIADIAGARANIDKKEVAVCFFTDVTTRKTAEEVIKESYAKLQVLFDSIDDFVFIFNSDGYIIRVNSAVYNRLGYSPKDIVGMRGEELHPLEMRNNCTHLQEEDFKKQFTVCSLPLMTKYGVQIPVETRLNRACWGKEEITIAISRDVTPLIQAYDALKDSQALYKATIDSIDYAIHVIDINRRILVTNKKFEHWAKILNINTDVLGKTLVDAIPFLSTRVNVEYDTVFETGKPVITEEDNLINSEHIYTETRKLPVLDGNVVNRIVTSVEDITVRKKVENAIKKRLEIEEMLARVSTEFINLEPERFQEEVQSVLNNFRELMGVDRFTVSIVNDDKTRFKKIIQSCRPGVNSTIEKTNLLRLDDYPVLLDMFFGGKILSFDDLVADTTSKSKISLFLDELESKSMLAAPIISRGQLFGLINFNMINCTRIWNEEDEFVLRMVGEIIANALIYIIQCESLKESEEKNRAIIHTSPNYIILLDEDQTIIECNQLASILFNCPADTLRGKNIIDLGRCIGINVEELHNLFLKIIAGEDIGPVEIEVQMSCDSSKKIWLELKISSLNIKDKQFIQLVGNDITKQKHAEQLVNEEVDKLRLLDKMRTEFIYRASHELKTPLSSVCCASALLSKYSAELSEDEKDLVNIIIRGGDRLKKLVESMVDSIRIEENSLKVKKEKVNLTNMIYSIVEQHRFLLNKRKHHLSIKLPVVLNIEVDIEKFEAIINNLLFNAINNTQPGGNISIELIDFHDRIELAVSDTGIGLTPEEIPKLFTKFGKIERYGKGIDLISEGSGLGLYISKNVIELHEGSIRVDSKGRNKGSTFIISLPYTKHI